MQLLVVRHAHAGSRERWDADDRIRPLSPRGMAQAFALAEALAAYQPTRILSSPALRCRQTVEPLAGRLGRRVEVDDRLDEGTSAAPALALVAELAPECAVVCSHGDVIPRLLGHYHDHGMVTDHPLEWQKGSVWVLERRGEDVLSGKYLPPPDRR